MEVRTRKLILLKKNRDRCRNRPEQRSFFRDDESSSDDSSIDDSDASQKDFINLSQDFIQSDNQPRTTRQCTFSEYYGGDNEGELLDISQEEDLNVCDNEQFIEGDFLQFPDRNLIEFPEEQVEEQDYERLVLNEAGDYGDEYFLHGRASDAGSDSDARERREQEHMRRLVEEFNEERIRHEQDIAQMAFDFYSKLNLTRVELYQKLEENLRYPPEMYFPEIFEYRGPDEMVQREECIRPASHHEAEGRNVATHRPQNIHDSEEAGPSGLQRRQSRSASRPQHFHDSQEAGPSGLQRRQSRSTSRPQNFHESQEAGPSGTQRRQSRSTSRRIDDEFTDSDSFVPILGREDFGVNENVPPTTFHDSQEAGPSGLQRRHSRSTSRQIDEAVSDSDSFVPILGREDFGATNDEVCRKYEARQASGIPRASFLPKRVGALQRQHHAPSKIQQGAQPSTTADRPRRIGRLPTLIRKPTGMKPRIVPEDQVPQLATKKHVPKSHSPDPICEVPVVEKKSAKVRFPSSSRNPLLSTIKKPVGQKQLRAPQTFQTMTSTAQKPKTVPRKQTEIKHTKREIKERMAMMCGSGDIPIEEDFNPERRTVVPSQCAVRTTATEEYQTHEQSQSRQSTPDFYKALKRKFLEYHRNHPRKAVKLKLPTAIKTEVKAPPPTVKKMSVAERAAIAAERRQKMEGARDEKLRERLGKYMAPKKELAKTPKAVKPSKSLKLPVAPKKLLKSSMKPQKPIKPKLRLRHDDEVFKMSESALMELYQDFMKSRMNELNTLKQHGVLNKTRAEVALEGMYAAKRLDFDEAIDDADLQNYKFPHRKIPVSTPKIEQPISYRTRRIGPSGIEIKQRIVPSKDKTLNDFENSYRGIRNLGERPLTDDASLIAGVLQEQEHTTDFQRQVDNIAPVISVSDGNIEATVNQSGVLPHNIPVQMINLNSETALDELNRTVESIGQQGRLGNILTNEIGGTSAAPVKSMKEIDAILYSVETQPFRKHNFVQIRGSNTPQWFPGMFTAFPIGDSRVEMIKSPNEILNKAWNILQPS